MADLFPREVVESTVVNDTNHGAILTVVVALCICCSFIFLSVRLLIRRPWKALFGKDDALVAVSTVRGPSPWLAHFAGR